MDENHILIAGYDLCGHSIARPANRDNGPYQYDYGQILRLEGFPEGMLPQTFEMHFGIGNGESVTMIGQDGDVPVPDQCLTTHGTKTAWLYLHDTASDGETRYVIETQVTPRARITNQEPTPTQQDTIAQAIAALNGGVAAAEEAREGAEEARDAAASAADSVMNARAEAETLDAGVPAAASVTNDEGIITFHIGIPKGDTGDAPIDDTAGMGAGSVVWSADKSYTVASGKADRADTVLDNTLSRGRQANTAAGTGSIAFGNNATASGNYSQAFGDAPAASGNYASAEGYRTTASGAGGHSEGIETVADGDASHSEGDTAWASGDASHAEGEYTSAIGDVSHAQGSGTTASGFASDASGLNTVASGTQATAEGESTIAQGNNQHVMGRYNVADEAQGGQYASIIGNGANGSSRSNAAAVDWNGNVRIAGDVYVGCEADSTGGSKLAKVSQIPDISGKLDKPTVAGANGQVLTSNGRGGQTWATPASGGAEIDDTAGTGDTDKVWSADKTAEEISDVTDLADAKAPAIVETASGPIASFADGADDMPLQECVAQIEPVQSGEGDPAPDNVRPITGWTELNGAVSNARLYEKSVNGLARGTISGSDGTNSGANTRLRTGYILVKPNCTYTVYTNMPYVYIHEYSDNLGTYIGHSPDWINNPAQITTSATTEYIRIVLAKATPAAGSGHIDVYVSDLVYCDVLESGASNPIHVEFPSEAGTVYGGTLTIHQDGTGELVVDRANIANYAGETLPGEWISDRDVYVAGTTPTIGAQVVYVLAVPIIYELDTEQVIRTLLGENHIWADCGDISSLTYSADPKLYIDQHTPSVPVQDVQVAGTSVVSQGVANVPIASNSVAGVVKVESANGIGIESQNKLYIDYAPSNLIKAGTGNYRPVTPPRQHEAVFYGLAKASGDTSQSSSSNAVGTYTDAAKVAIQKMLGIYQAPWELIREDTFTNVTSANHTITVDGNGQPFELTDIIIQFETPVQDTASSASGGIYFYSGANYARVLCNAWTQAAQSLEPHGCMGVVKQHNNLLEVYRAQNATVSNTAAIGVRYGAGFRAPGETERVGYCLLSSPFIVDKIIIDAVVGTGHYKLLGKRKWN